MTKQRLGKLEAADRAALLERIQEMEKQISQRMSDDQLFAVTVCLAMSDEEVRQVEDQVARSQILRRRRRKVTLPKLRADVIALQWALQQFELYEKPDHHLA